MTISMDTQTFTIVLGLAQLALTLIAALIGWFVRSLFQSIDELKKADAKLADEVVAMRVSMPERYVSKGDFKDALDNIFTMLRQIDGKIDNKADKGKS